jgi:hypothetical protein
VFTEGLFCESVCSQPSGKQQRNYILWVFAKSMELHVSTLSEGGWQWRESFQVPQGNPLPLRSIYPTPTESNVSIQTHIEAYNSSSDM